MAVLYVVPGTGLSLMVRETSIYQFEVERVEEGMLRGEEADGVG